MGWLCVYAATLGGAAFYLLHLFAVVTAGVL